MVGKEVDFTGSDSAERVRRLQALCAQSDAAGNGSDGAFDGILIIGGVDSFHSEISQAVLKYLFMGSSGQELLGEQVISQAHERLEEIVLMITRHRITIFHSSESEAAVKILPKISQWRNVTAYTVHDGMDLDDQEERKIRAFKQMVQGVKRIGIPYGVDRCGVDLTDSMIPEKWPLVQSFGLENGANGVGFFTMNHRVINISRLLRDEMSKLDNFNARRIVKEVEPFLAHHFDQFLIKLDHAESPQTRNSKSESEIGEDLISFYDFGTTQYESRGVKVDGHRGSRVLFGKRTSNVTTASSSSVFLRDAGVDKEHEAVHMLVQTEDPFTGVRFTRTYFLATGKDARLVIDEDALVHDNLDGPAITRENFLDTTLLIELNVLLLRGFKAAIKAFVQEHSERGVEALKTCLDVAKAQAISAMQEYSRVHSQVLETKGLSQHFLDERLVMDMECLDACGRSTCFPAPEWNLVYISLEVKQIPSQVTPCGFLGSLIVGDTILFRPSTSKISFSDKTTRGVFLNVTSPFPYFRAWVNSGSEAESAKKLLAVLQSDFMLQGSALQLGHPLMPLDAALDEGSGVDPNNAATSISPSTATHPLSSLGLSKAVLVVESYELPILRGKMQLFTGGFCFASSQMSPLLISFAKHVSSFRVLSTAFEELVLLQLELKRDTSDYGSVLSEVFPFFINKRTITFPLLAGTRFQEEMVRALRTWNTTAEHLEIPFYRTHDLSQFEGTTPRDGTTSAMEISPMLADICDELVRGPQESVSKVFGLFFPHWFIPKDATPSTTLPRPKHDRSKLCVPITVVIGLPGSDAATVAHRISHISSASYAWEHVIVDSRTMKSTMGNQFERYAYTQVQDQIGSTLRYILNGESDLPPRIMLSVVGYIDPITVAAAIKEVSHLPSWCLPTRVSTIIACVSALNVYLPDILSAQCPLPKLLDQLTGGFTTHVVLTHSSEVTASHLGRLRYHIDQTNPFADTYVLSSDVFEGPITSLLSLDRFESAYYKNYRDAFFPNWDLKQNWEEYAAELDWARVPETVSFTIAPGMEKMRFLHTINRTLTPFATWTKFARDIFPAESVSPMKANSKGIRLAQSIAAGKVIQSQNPIDEGANLGYGTCWCVEATLTFAGDADNIFDYVATASYARLHGIQFKHQRKETQPDLEIKITGQHLNADKLHSLVLGCYASMDGQVQPMKNKTTVSLAEKREIQKKHVSDPLPAGFYFDGISYYDSLGARHEFHPFINQFIDEHVSEQNESVEKNNAKVEENRKSQQTFVRQIV